MYIYDYLKIKSKTIILLKSWEKLSPHSYILAYVQMTSGRTHKLTTGRASKKRSGLEYGGVALLFTVYSFVPSERYTRTCIADAVELVNLKIKIKCFQPSVTTTL